MKKKDKLRSFIREEVKKELEKEIENKQINIRVKNMSNEYIVGKMFQHIAGKSITGNSETGSAADGGALVTTGIAEIAPVVMMNSVVYAKTRKIPVQKGCNAMKVPVSINSFVKGTAPVISNPAEGVAATASKVQFDARTLTLTKSAINLAVTAELLEDAASMDAFVRSEIVGKLAQVLDYECLLGSAAGFVGANDDSGYTTGVSISATPTLAEIQKVRSSVYQTLNPEWFMSVTLWNLMVGTFGTAANLQNQLIDIAGYKLLGAKVNVIPSLGAADLVFGDFSQYTVIESPLSDRLQVSADVRFLEDEVVYKLIHRGAGAISTKAIATGDSLAVGAFSCKS
jgi:HK97 family phage major capsid protein